MNNLKIAPLQPKSNITYSKPIPVASDYFYARKQHIISLFLEGIPSTKLATRFGVSKQRIHQILSSKGITKKDGGKYLEAQNKIKIIKEARVAKCISIYGCAPSDYKKIPTKALRAYTMQKNTARVRGVGWEFKLADWWAVWQASGKWPARGRGQGYAMCRKGDHGPYRADNVYFVSCAQNISDGAYFRKGALLKPGRRRRGNQCRSA